LHYYVACLSDSDRTETYQNAQCFHMKVPSIGSAKAIVYDLKAVNRFLDFIARNKLSNCVLLILACRIGPMMPLIRTRCEKMNVKILVNPDGHEWKRGKWGAMVKRYWKYSEKLMVKHAQMLVCDSVNIQKYIIKEYACYSPKTCFIPYGAEIPGQNAQGADVRYRLWLAENGIEKGGYLLVVGRFVPENNYLTVIREFLMSTTKKDLVLITDCEGSRFYKELSQKTNMERDSRVKFVGTVYDKQLLAQIRSGAFAYVHGHEVGGTNPSLLEALATTRLNLLLDVPFNREVAQDGAMYFTKEFGNFRDLIAAAEGLPEELLVRLWRKAIGRIKTAYTWTKIVDTYEELFIRTCGESKGLSKMPSDFKSTGLRYAEKNG
jgi:rhamnosyltransferase